MASAGWQPNWFDVAQTAFMRHAFIGGALVALASALIGWFVVVRGDAFASHALAHIGFPGATGALLVGAPITLGLLVFCVAGAIVIGVLGRRTSERQTTTGNVLAFATALGVLFSSLASRSASTVTSVLFGNLLAISVDQLRVFALLLLAVVLALTAIGRPLAFASLNPEVAEARGVPVRALGLAFLVLLAIVVTMAVQVVGTLLLFALLVTPSAAALKLTARPAAAVAIAGAIGLGSVWGGLVLSAMFNLPPSFFIVSLACLAWLTTLVLERNSG